MITESPMLNEHPTATPSLSIDQRLMTTRLTHENEPEVLRFLAERPLHTAVMSGFIRDNGMENKLNRGTFYGCRNIDRILEGVSLIGHAMFIDARSDGALREFARVAQQFPNTHMVMGEQEMMERFRQYYSAPGQPSRRLCREVLFELTRLPAAIDEARQLRLAEAEDLPLIVPVHATMAFEESGVNPLQVDPYGFRMRCARRIEQRRVWVFVEHGELIFKTDVISDTPDVTYLEGVYVNPNHRDRGHGSRCLSQLARHLLSGTKSISLLVNQERRQAQNFFKQLGFVPRGLYDTIFFGTQTDLL